MFHKIVWPLLLLGAVTYESNEVHYLSNQRGGNGVLLWRSDTPIVSLQGYHLWGTGGLYLHDMSNHPYAYSTAQNPSNPGTIISTPRKISVFRPNHQSNSSINPPMGKYRILNNYQHEVLCSYCAGSVVQTEYHNFVTVGALTKCSKCGFIQGISPNKAREVKSVK